MGFVAAVTVALVIWIVLWAVGFGRAGDAFILFVPLITVIAAAARTLLAKNDEAQRS